MGDSKKFNLGLFSQNGFLDSQKFSYLDLNRVVCTVLVCDLDFRGSKRISKLKFQACSATAATNYPSLSNLPNGCQGHPRPCLSPPDRPPITEPDSNDVLTRSNFYSTIGIGRHKMHKAVEA